MIVRCWVCFSKSLTFVYSKGLSTDQRANQAAAGGGAPLSTEVSRDAEPLRVVLAEGSCKGIPAG